MRYVTLDSPGMPRGQHPCGSSSAGWCALCYANIRGRARYRGHRGYRAKGLVRSWRRCEMKFLVKPDPAASAALAAGPVDGGKFGEAHPALWEYLTCGQWPDGTPRERATLLVLYEDGLLKACLNDKASLRAVWISCDEWPALLKSLDRALQDGTAAWRHKAAWVPPGKKKG